MKLKPSHFLAAAVAFICGFVVLAFVYVQTQEPADTTVENDDAFLAEVRELQAQQPAPETVGSVPAIADDGGEGPRIAFENDVIDLGRLPNDRESTHQVPFFNRGDSPLRISRIQSGSRSLRATIDGNEVVPPGEKGVLEIVCDPFAITGWRIDTGLTIFSNDTNRPHRRINFTADVEREFELVPPQIDFGTVAKGEPAEKTVILRQLQQKPFRLEAVNTTRGTSETNSLPHPALAFDFAERPPSEWKHPDKKEYDVTARLLPEAPPGKLQTTVYLETNLQRLPTAPVVAQAQVTAPYEITPTPPDPVLLRSGLDPQSPARGTATVRSNQPIVVDGLHYNGSLLEVTVKEGESEGIKHIDVAVLPDAPAGLMIENIRFRVRGDAFTLSESIAVRAFLSDGCGCSAQRS